MRRRAVRRAGRRACGGSRPPSWQWRRRRRAPRPTGASGRRRGRTRAARVRALARRVEAAAPWQRVYHWPVEPLPRSFYDRNAVKVAPALLGCVLARRVRGGGGMGRIVETGAYVGEHDLARPAPAGRATRTGGMYGEPGHAYVYLIYGIHQMLNCVCGPGSDANAVLIRAVEPLPDSAPWLHPTARGPGNVCKAFGIERAQNRADLCDPEGE